MRAKVLKSFTDKNWFTRSKGQDFVTDDEAYLASLVDEGKVELVDSLDPETPKETTSEKTKARKASKKNERETILPRRRRR